MQESACLQLYHTAIRHQQDGQLEQARTLYREVLESEVMEEVIDFGHFCCYSNNSSLHVMFIIQKGHLSNLNVLDIKWSRYGLTNSYTFYMGDLHWWHLQTQSPHMGAYKMCICL